MEFEKLRSKMENETNEEYLKYVKGYCFNLLPPKPRNRGEDEVIGYNETDEEYVKYLETYYDAYYYQQELISILLPSLVLNNNKEEIKDEEVLRIEDKKEKPLLIEDKSMNKKQTEEVDKALKEEQEILANDVSSILDEETENIEEDKYVDNMIHSEDLEDEEDLSFFERMKEKRDKKKADREIKKSKKAENKKLRPTFKQIVMGGFIGKALLSLGKAKTKVGTGIKNGFKTVGRGIVKAVKFTGKVLAAPFVALYKFNDKIIDRIETGKVKDYDDEIEEEVKNSRNRINSRLHPVINLDNEFDGIEEEQTLDDELIDMEEDTIEEQILYDEINDMEEETSKVNLDDILDEVEEDVYEYPVELDDEFSDIEESKEIEGPRLIKRIS